MSPLDVLRDALDRFVYDTSDRKLLTEGRDALVKVEALVTAAQSVVAFLPSYQQVLDLRDALVPFAEEV